MAKRSTVLLTDGQAGSGKSYVRCAIHSIEFLVSETGYFISNFPIDIEKVSLECAKRTGKDASTFAKRILVIPPKILKGWEERITSRTNTHLSKGPWTFFDDVDNLDDADDSWAGSLWSELVFKYYNEVKEREVYGINLADSHVAIDEVHNFVSTSTPKHQRERWSIWLGEIRHRGATIEFITQHKAKFADELKNECTEICHLVNLESEYDPLFNIRQSYWYELLAAFTRNYKARVKQVFTKKDVDERGRCIEVNSRPTRIFPLDPYYFKMYNSYNSPHSGGSGVKAPKHEFQKRSILGVVRWFLVPHMGNIFGSKIFILIAALLLFACGGFSCVAEKGLSSITGKKVDLTKKGIQSQPAKVQPLQNSADVDVNSAMIQNSILSGVDITDPNFLSSLRFAQLKIMFVAPDLFIDVNGIVFRKGDDCYGNKIESIDYENRCVVFGDGGRVWLQSNAPATKLPSPIQ